MKSSKLGFLGILFVLFGMGVRVDADANFVLSNLQVPERVINRIPTLDVEIPIKITVTNTGDTSGTCILLMVIDQNLTNSKQKRVTLRAGESKEVEFNPRRFGDPLKAMYPGNKKMTGATYEIEVADVTGAVRQVDEAIETGAILQLDGLTDTVSVTPFPDFTIYAIGLDVLCIIGTALFIRWVTRTG